MMDNKRILDQWSVQAACEALGGLHATITTAAQHAQESLESQYEEFLKDHQGDIPDTADEVWADEAFTLSLVRSAMYGGLAVAIASAAEKRVKAFVKKHRSAGDSKDEAYDRLRQMTGFSDYNRARLLGNCFKHCNGKASQEYVDKMADGTTVGQELNFVDQDWEAMIRGTQALLHQIV
jgi:hypothetical protein